MLNLKSFVPQRRWFRFSLGTFLLAVAVMAYGWKWVLDRVKLCAGQYELVAGMSVNGADYHRSVVPPRPGIVYGEGGERFEHTGGFTYKLAEPTGWEWTVAGWLGMNYEVDVVDLALFEPRANQKDDMKVALRLPQLKHLLFHGDAITPEVIADIKKMKQLERVTFWNTNMTSDSAADLKSALPNAHITVSLLTPVGNDEYEKVTVADLP